MQTVDIVEPSYRKKEKLSKMAQQTKNKKKLPAHTGGGTIQVSHTQVVYALTLSSKHEHQIEWKTTAEAQPKVARSERQALPKEEKSYN